MKKNARICAALAACALIISLTGCTATGSGTAGTTASPSPSPAASPAVSASAQPEPTSQQTSGFTTGTDAIAVEYTDRDFEDTWNADSAVTVALDSTYTITSSGTYIFSGTLADGQIIVRAADTDKIQLVLNGVDITSKTGSAIYIESADKVFVTLPQSSENTLTDAAEYTAQNADGEPDGALFSKCDLTINGSGALTVNANMGDGIVGKDDLVITGGIITVTAADDALRGTDAVAICGGELTLTAGGDGIKSTKADDAAKGWVSIDGGSIGITAACDGVQAETALMVTGGSLAISSGGGSANASTTSSGGINGGWGSWGSASSDAESSDSAKGVKAAGSILISGGVLSIDSSDDSVHSNGDITISGGELTLSSGDDGVHADAALLISGGSVTVGKSYEGLEGLTVTISDGTVNVTASDDGINAAGGTDTGMTGRPGMNGFSESDSDCSVTISGGSVLIDAGGDGLDSNGNLYVTGGTVLVYGPTNSGNGALDYGGSAEITGGTVIACGASGMAENFSSTSTQYSVLITLNGALSGGEELTLKDSNGSVVASCTPTKEYNSVVISTPELKEGEYTLTSGGSEAASVTLTGVITGSGAGMAGMGGMGGGPGGFRQ